MKSTKRILYAEDVIELRELNKYLFEYYFDVEIVEADNSMKAIEILSHDKNFDLIISDLNMHGGNGDQIFHHMQSQNMRIPFVLLTGSVLESHDQLSKIPHYRKPLETDEVFKIIDEQLPSVVRRQNQHYVSISANFLSVVKELHADVFVKINEGKFIKIFRKGTSVDLIEIEKHTKKGVTSFYVVANEFVEFTSEYQRKIQLSEVWTDASLLAFDESLNINVDMIRSLGDRLAASPEFTTHMIEQVKTAVKLLSQDEQFGFLMKRFSDRAEVSFSEHCSLIIYTAGTLLQDHPRLDFDSSIRSISIAALIHDASLDDRLFQMKRDLISKGVFKNLEKGSEDYKLIYSHPFRAAELSRKFPFCPAEVQTIVVQHHEMPGGKGFPLGCEGSELHPLSIFFIVAEDFVENYLASGEDLDIQQFIKSRAAIYNDSYFSPVFALLKSKLLVSH